MPINLSNRGDVIISNVITLTNTTETTLQSAGGVGVFLDLVCLVIANTSISAVRVDVRDSTGGTVVMSFVVPAGDTRGVSLAIPRNQTTANNNWTVQLSASVTDVRVSGHFIRRL